MVKCFPLLLLPLVGEEGSVSRSVTNLSDSICHGLEGWLLSFGVWKRKFRPKNYDQSHLQRRAALGLSGDNLYHIWSLITLIAHPPSNEPPRGVPPLIYLIYFRSRWRQCRCFFCFRTYLIILLPPRNGFDHYINYFYLRASLVGCTASSVARIFHNSKKWKITMADDYPLGPAEPDHWGRLALKCPFMRLINLKRTVFI